MPIDDKGAPAKKFATVKNKLQGELEDLIDGKKTKLEDAGLANPTKSLGTSDNFHIDGTNKGGVICVEAQLNRADGDGNSTVGVVEIEGGVDLGNANKRAELAEALKKSISTGHVMKLRK